MEPADRRVTFNSKVPLHHRSALTPLLMLAATALLAGCRPPQTVASADNTSPSAPPDKHQVWQLVSVRGKEVSRSRNITTLVFNPESATLGGQGPCNSYSASYSLGQPTSDSRRPLTVSHLVAASVQCPEPTMNSEARFLNLLAHADAISATPYTLTLFQNHKPTLHFELQ